MPHSTDCVLLVVVGLLQPVASFRAPVVTTPAAVATCMCVPAAHACVMDLAGILHLPGPVLALA